MHTIDKTSASLCLLGKVINQAIQDSLSDTEYREEAREFIFSSRLSDFLKRFHIDGLVNADYIRKQVLAGHKEFFLETEHFTEERELPGPGDIGATGGI